MMRPDYHALAGDSAPEADPETYCAACGDGPLSEDELTGIYGGLCGHCQAEAHAADEGDRRYDMMREEGY
jgi:hypothetical protein